MLTRQASVLGEDLGSREKVETDRRLWNVRPPSSTGTPAIYVHTPQITHTHQGKKAHRSQRKIFFSSLKTAPMFSKCRPSVHAPDRGEEEIVPLEQASSLITLGR